MLKATLEVTIPGVSLGISLDEESREILATLIFCNKCKGLRLVGVE